MLVAIKYQTSWKIINVFSFHFLLLIVFASTNTVPPPAPEIYHHALIRFVKLNNINSNISLAKSRPFYWLDNALKAAMEHKESFCLLLFSCTLLHMHPPWHCLFSLEIKLFTELSYFRISSFISCCPRQISNKEYSGFKWSRYFRTVSLKQKGLDESCIRL